MYKYLDRRVGELESRDRMLLWAMRKWVLSASFGRCPCATLAPAFAFWRIGGTLPSFALAMLLLNTQAHTRFVLRAPCASHVNDDEARLLALFDAGACRSTDLLKSLTRDLVPPEDAEQLASAVELVAGPMAAASAQWSTDLASDDGR